MCFVWISEQTAIISLYSINWLVFITEAECLLRGTDWVFIYNLVILGLKTEEACVRTRANQHEIYSGQFATGTGIAPC